MVLATFSALGVPFASADAPAAPSNPYPSTGSSGVTIFITLQWTGDAQSVAYDVYFGIENPPALVMANQTVTTYNPGILEVNTTYFWQIIAYNEAQETNASPIWVFSTAPDAPPFPPTVIAGPTAAGRGIALNFTAIAPDPEGDSVYYQWNWGDGNISDWFGPYEFGEHAIATYQYIDDGSYIITVRAKDVHGAQSGWSMNFPVAIAPQLNVTNIKKGYAYFTFFDYDLGYGYIYSLDLLGMSLIISNGGFNVYANVTGNVQSVRYQMSNLFYTDEIWTVTDDNISNDSSIGNFEMNSGLYKATITVYDANGNLIDKVVRDYVIYYQWKFTIIKKLISKITGVPIS
jgi:hypothetical protein